MIRVIERNLRLRAERIVSRAVKILTEVIIARAALGKAADSSGNGRH